MTICLTCKYRDDCYEIALNKIRGDCKNYSPQTNADYIRAMTDEELSIWLTNYMFAVTGDGACARSRAIRGELLDWLKQGARE